MAASNIDKKVIIGYFYDETTEQDVIDYFEKNGHEIESAQFLIAETGKSMEITFKNEETSTLLKDKNETHFIGNEALMIQPDMAFAVEDENDVKMMMETTPPKETLPKKKDLQAEKNQLDQERAQFEAEKRKWEDECKKQRAIINDANAKKVRLGIELKECRQLQMENERQKTALEKAKAEHLKTKAGLDYAKIKNHDDRLGILTRDINELRNGLRNLKEAERSEYGKHEQDRLVKIENWVRDVNDKIKELDNSITKVARWNAKHHIILEGDDIPLEAHGEDIIEISRKLVQDKYGIKIGFNELAQSHRLFDRGLKRRIIMLFKDFKPESSFSKILECKEIRDQRMDLTAKQKLCAFDEKLETAALELKRHGKIRKVGTNIMSGRIKVQKKDNKYMTVYTQKDIEKLSQENESFQAFPNSPVREDDLF